MKIGTFAVAAGLLLAVTAFVEVAAAETCEQALEDASRTPSDHLEQMEVLQQHYESFTTDESGDFLPTEATAFIACVTGAITDGLADPISLEPETRSALLAQIGFLGNRTFWNSPDARFKNRLRQASRNLKNAPPRDEDLIFAIDMALSFEKHDLRAGLVAPVSDQPADELYRLHVEAKKAAIEEAMSHGYYDDGPLEGTLHDLYAVVLEQEIFLDGRVLQFNDEKPHELVEKALNQYQVILDLLARARDDERPMYFGSLDASYLVNDYRYRYAIMLLVANRREAARSQLAEIVQAADTWDPESLIDHIYIDTFMKHPYKITLVEEDGAFKQLESEVIRRFFNPYQLAAFTCSLFDRFKLELFPYDDALKILKGFHNHDYRVYVASSYELSDMEQLLDRYNKSLARNTTPEEFAKVAAPEPGFPDAIRTGLKECLGVETGEMVNVYEPAEPVLRGNWEAWSEAEQSAGQKAFGIYFGGYLSYEAAIRIAAKIRDALRLDAEPYPARPRLEG